MQSSELLAWLAAPADFAAGVALYAQQPGRRSMFQQLFALGETSYSRQVLVRELRAAVEGAPVPVPPPALASPPANSPLLADVRARLKETRDERSYLHAQLTASGLRQRARNTMAHRICTLTDQVQQHLAAEAHVLEHGRLPGPLATAELTDAGELRRRLDNLVSRRAKLRKRPDRADELPALEEEITLIRTKLNTPS